MAPGAALAYTLMVTNGGPDPADGAVLRDPVAAGLVKTGTPALRAERRRDAIYERFGPIRIR